ELAEELKAHLMAIGKYCQAQYIITFLNRPKVQGAYNLKNTIHISTAQHWMHALKFCWVKNHKGQYVNGHKREDVYQMEGRTQTGTGDNLDIKEAVDAINDARKKLVIWFHNESIFYVHDHQTAQWVANDASPSPYAKGEGVSLMVTDF
ncbi:hypothetical protein B0H10DRAFT_1713763, partial [Mycena sp. CBHHK59/15]